MHENKQAICDKMCEAIQLTRAGGEGNALVRLEYDAENEVVWPWFEDGRYYRAINVACDSGIAVITDIVKQFVKEVW